MNDCINVLQCEDCGQLFVGMSKQDLITFFIFISRFHDSLGSKLVAPEFYDLCCRLIPVISEVI